MRSGAGLGTEVEFLRSGFVLRTTRHPAPRESAGLSKAFFLLLPTCEDSLEHKSLKGKSRFTLG